MSKKCPNCGAELEDNALFCDECGSKLDQQTSSQQTTPSVTPKETNNTDVSSKTVTAPDSTEIMKNSGLGIASMIFGILGIFTLGCFFIPEILGLIFGIIAMGNKTKKHNFAVVGIVTSAIAFILIIVILIL